jgi:putative peptidoglycan lipid II flippase
LGGGKSVTQETRKNIRRASGVMALSVVLSRVIGFVREWVFTQTLGASSTTDVYLSSFVIPDFLNYLMAAGALSISLIPILSECLSQGNPKLSEKVFRTVSTVMSLFLLVLIFLGEVFAQKLGSWVAPGYNPEQRELLTQLLRIILPAQFFFYWGGLAMSVQQTHGRFIYTALAPIFYNFGIIVCGLVLYKQLGVMGFSVGVVVGSLLGHGILQWWGLKKLGYSCWPSFDFSTEILSRFKKYLWVTFPIMLSFSLVVTDEWISKYFGSFLQPKAVSYLSYARTEMRIPIAVIGQAAGMASFPYLSRLWSEKNYGQYVDTLLAEISKLWALGPIAASLVVFNALPLTHFIYGGGKLNSFDLEQTATVLEIFGLGIFFWTSQILLSRGFYAAQKTWLPSIWGTVLSALMIPIYYVSSKKYSYFGLAASGTLGIFIYCFLLWIMLKRHISKVAPQYDYSDFRKFFIKWSFVILSFCLLSWIIPQLGIYQGTRFSAFLQLSIAGGVVGGGTLWVLRKYFPTILA